MGNQLLGHGLGQIGIDNGDIGSDLKVGDGVLDALLIIGDNGESGHLSGGAGGGRDGAEVGLAAERRNAEHLAHLLKGDLRVLVLDPHGLCGINGGAAAHGNDPVGLKLQHGLCAAHDGLNRGIGLNALKQLHFHAGFLQVANSAVKEAEPLHGAAADTDHGLFAGKGLQGFQSTLAVVQIAGKSKTSHRKYLRFNQNSLVCGCLTQK